MLPFHRMGSVPHRHAHMGSYNTHHIFGQIVIWTDCQWDNVSFHCSALIQNLVSTHFPVLYLPCSPFLNPIEEWRGKGYDFWPRAQMLLLKRLGTKWTVMQGWSRHSSSSSFQSCLAKEDIACYVEEILWPAREETCRIYSRVTPYFSDLFFFSF